MASIDNLWAPWRLEYVAGDKPSDGCVLCAKQHQDDQDALIVARGELVYVMLNLYPYNNGHLMVVPYRHVAQLEQLTRAESEEAQRMLERGIIALREALGPGGFNVGLNLGEAAGAGIASHLHWHLVPRWQGDTNFMPVLADVRVMPEHISKTWRSLRDTWPTGDNQQETEEGDPNGV